MTEIDVVEMYVRGATLVEAAAASGLSVSSVVRRLDHAGVQRRPRGQATRRHAANTARRAALTEAVLTGYAAEESALSLAGRLGVSRTVIRHILDEHGVDLRGVGEAQELRMARLDEKQRRELVAAANAARREQGETSFEAVRRAAVAEQRRHLTALGEAELSALLSARGLDPVPQLAIGRHNVDLAVAPVAIEVHRKISHPFRTDRLRDRAADLVDAGWRVLYVWCAAGVRRGPGQVCFTEQCADQVVAHVERARTGDVDGYRVLRCTGEDAHAGTPTGRAANRPETRDL